MNKKTFTSALATLLVVLIVAPSAFFIAPQRASASAASCIGGLLGLGGMGVGAVLGLASVPVSNLSIEASSGSTAGSTGGSCINDVILIPLARAAMRAILQKMTASVVNWINGANGTGQPSYVQNVQGNMQRLGDANALAFFAQFAGNSNSPFATAVVSSLRSAYLQQSSMAGFFAANQCTLAQSSPNPNAFLAGDWSQGGTAEWFALTTQSQNNPYTLYENSQTQLDSTIGSAQAARAAQLSWGQGFLSWCGVTAAATQTQGSASAAYQACMAACTGNDGNCGDRCQATFEQAGGNQGSTGTGVNPGDSCTNADGTPGTIETPGSVIHDYTQKAVVASGFDQIISATDLDNALGTIVGALANQVLGSVTGLFGASSSSGSTGRSGLITSQLQGYSDSSITPTQTAFQTAQTMLTRVTTYTNAWNTITTAANAASTSVTSLASFCTAAATTAKSDPRLATFAAAATAEATAAQAIPATVIAPILAQAQTAVNAVASTTAFALQVEAASASATAGTSGTLAADVPVLVAMPPSAADVGNAQSAASVMGAAFANPAGSLTVAGGSLVDQMNLLSTNAAALKTTVCTAPALGTGG